MLVMSTKVRSRKALEGQPPSEEALVRACQQGDSAACGKLVDLYWQGVYAYVHRLTQQRSDAEDLAQETFLHALQGLAQYRPDGHLRSWLLRIATNLFLDQKKASRSRDVSLDESRFAQWASPPDEMLDRKQLIQALREALEDLSREQQVVVLLRAVDQMTYGEIADILQTKEAAARWHMYEARRILRQKLGAKFNLPRDARDDKE
jgi:RNA polymerase sigma-70 factor (ECF subfamily)